VDEAQVDGAVDIWVNLVTRESAAAFVGQEQYANIPGYLGGDGEQGVGVDDLLARMDRAGVATGVLTPGLSRSTMTPALEVAATHQGRFLVSGTITDPSRPTRNVVRIRELAQHPLFSMVRIAPMF
jgi:hypothetical protein